MPSKSDIDYYLYDRNKNKKTFASSVNKSQNINNYKPISPEKPLAITLTDT